MIRFTYAKCIAPRSFTVPAQSMTAVTAEDSAAPYTTIRAVADRFEVPAILAQTPPFGVLTIEFAEGE